MEFSTYQRQVMEEVLLFAEKQVFIKTGLELEAFFRPMAVDGEAGRLPPTELMRHVASKLSVKLEDLRSNSRRKRLVIARQVLCYLYRERYPKLSYKGIAQLLGGRDHTSIVHHYQRSLWRLEHDTEFAEWLRRCEKVFAKELISSEDGGM